MRLYDYKLCIGYDKSDLGIASMDGGIKIWTKKI